MNRRPWVFIIGVLVVLLLLLAAGVGIAGCVHSLTSGVHGSIDCAPNPGPC